MREIATQSKTSSSNAKRHSKATKAAAKKGTKKRKELTAKEATLRAWQMTYENRHKRLD